MSMLSGVGITQMLYHSDWMTKAVLFTLFAMSVACWTIFLYKLVIWRVKKQQIRKTIARMKNAENLEDVLHITTKFAHTLPGYFLSKNLSYLKSILTTKEQASPQIQAREWEMLDHMVFQTLDSIVHTEESQLPVLGAATAISPLLGLFGTVWGLVNAFMDISQKQSADITAVAPGIAQALTTTVAGLLVAIPALVMFYYLNLQLRSMEQGLNALGDRFLWLSTRLFIQDKD
ncbi:MAG TPA: MotA/TolQ/ExbB proton channel family protein [Candidatus Babeliales bacterium]|nr:MotA/TolQ/ExbB proton channel family protein [Candidatus Babeliales bacterium]